MEWAALVRRLVPLGVERIYLFGSHARGTATRRSDVDLLVLWETPLPPLERIGQVLLALRELPWVVEPVVLTPAEFEARRHLPFLRSVIEEAKLLYERGKTAA
ncbi:nucleotidyltransferase domain-containing protein [Meiothermus sp. QL-1]|uniref:nucleotidyltransferase domain-containing protein n=1 Tax=Meiothermus sp. QL-1 TaxID=2058095 RepID=UPI000E0C5361|nr:nucleotidyltransferase domain-containing protein [Meiothermus sp. QL-1]RDI96147.1 nucleotidyltransferase domain-containing protein [Meiothermus sp. QL-1]